jgi:microcystin-dependent protein
MAQPYVGEIRMFAGSFQIAGWALCDGRPLPISENEILFQLIGTTYGGDGQSTFNLPDLQGRLPLHQGNGFILAETGGVESVTLTVAQIPSHSHPMLATETIADSPQPQDNIVGKSTTVDIFIGGGNPGTPFSPQAVGAVGGSQPHENMQPYLCITFLISLFGIFPSPS